jgi:hypothetical protein
MKKAPKSPGEKQLPDIILENQRRKMWSLAISLKIIPANKAVF